MNIRERMEAFWSGERPDKIPYTILDFLWVDVKDDPAWNSMFNDGLGVDWQSYTYKKQLNNVEVINKWFRENNKLINKITYSTSLGEINEIREHVDEKDKLGWRRKYLIETAEDYRVMAHITENTIILPSYEDYLTQFDNMPFYAVPVIDIGKSPFQQMLVDLVGLENFSFHLFDFEDEVQMLYEALLKQFRKIIDVVAHGPGKFVNARENFTSETVGPDRFAKYHVPVYKELYPILQSSGKIVGCHYDGRLNSCKELIANSPIDLIESLTPPSEGDMELDECRKVWPDKLFVSNIRLSDYYLPQEELHNRVLELVQQAAPDKRKLAFEVSEDRPENWKTSMPIVLKALNETLF